jgi:hypothetical protein
VVAAMVASVVVGGTVVAVVLAADATAGVAAMVAIRCFACAGDCMPLPLRRCMLSGVGVWCWGLMVIVRISLDYFFDTYGRNPCKMPWE